MVEAGPPGCCPIFGKKGPKTRGLPPNFNHDNVESARTSTTSVLSLHSVENSPSHSGSHYPTQPARPNNGGPSSGNQGGDYGTMTVYQGGHGAPTPQPFHPPGNPASAYGGQQFSHGGGFAPQQAQPGGMYGTPPNYNGVGHGAPPFPQGGNYGAQPMSNGGNYGNFPGNPPPAPKPHKYGMFIRDSPPSSPIRNPPHIDGFLGWGDHHM
ncbi:metacaspase-1-like [Belonocnema kinseyi]|uniref:metacaspase-1-like n=1 Tax=Belonocnema kinseyi TaxID=2817044 RepID=UPI00143D4A4D|nr:metacaspase-1-like [Belonocnema kinseyi]